MLLTERRFAMLAVPACRHTHTHAHTHTLTHTHTRTHTHANTLTHTHTRSNTHTYTHTHTHTHSRTHAHTHTRTHTHPACRHARGTAGSDASAVRGCHVLFCVLMDARTEPKQRKDPARHDLLVLHGIEHGELTSFICVKFHRQLSLYSRKFTYGITSSLACTGLARTICCKEEVMKHKNCLVKFNRQLSLHSRKITHGT